MRSMIRLIIALLLVVALAVPVLSPTPAMAAERTRVPTGDGDSSGTWTASTGSKWDCVNETTPGDADYVTGSTDSGGYCLFSFTDFDVPTWATNISLTVYIRGQDVGSNNSNSCPRIKVGGNYYDGDTGYDFTSMWFTTVSYTWTQNPDIPGAWTAADINNEGGASNPLQEIGVYSTDLSPDTRFSLVYALVSYECPDSKTRVPTGDGDSNGTWNASTGTKWDCVNETTPGDADYVTGTTDSGGYCLFTITDFDVPTGSTIDSLTVYIRGQDTQYNNSNSRPRIKVGGNYYDGDTGYDFSSGSFRTESYTWTQNPDIPGAWTVADINNEGGASNPLQEIGVYSTDLSPDTRFSLVYAEVCYVEAAAPPPEGDFGDAPEDAIAYPSTMTPGQFPTCITPGPPNSWIYHGPEPLAFFGGFVDPEPDGNAGTCTFPPYDQDECTCETNDAGLSPGFGMVPIPWTILPGPVVGACPGCPTGSPLGTTCQTAVWGVNVDIMVNNIAPEAFVNVLMDWNQNGMWDGLSTGCPPQGAPVSEHVLVNFPLTAIGGPVPLSTLMPPNFQIGHNDGYVWTRFTISEVPVIEPWDGSGNFDWGETEDYLLEIAQGPGINIDKYADETSVEAGQTIHYNYDVTNDDTLGNITGVTVSDDICTSPAYESGDTNTNDILEDGETWHYTCEYVTTLADLAAGSVANEATASGTGPGPTPVEAKDQESVPVTQPTPAANPPLEPCCGLDVVLVLDSSDSIDPISDVKNPAYAFVDAFLTGTDNLIGVVEFDDAVVPTTLDLTDVKGTIDARINAIVSGGFTNWEAGLTEARLMLENGYSQIISDNYASDRDDTLYPDLIIFITNGEPTTYGYPASLGSYNPPEEPEPEDIAAAIFAANAAKASTGTGVIRILYVGVDSTTTYGQQVSGDNVSPPFDPSDIATDAITTAFSTLGDAIAAQADQCGTIIVEKQTDPDLATETFDFTDNIEALNSFSLQDDGTETFENVLAGTYTVTESGLPADWNLTHIIFSETGDASIEDSTGDVPSATATIELQADETVTCVFANAISEEPSVPGEPGAPGAPGRPGGDAVGGEVYPVNKLALLAPWLGLALFIVIGGGILVVRRRTTR